MMRQPLSEWFTSGWKWGAPRRHDWENAHAPPPEHFKTRSDHPYGAICFDGWNWLQTTHLAIQTGVLFQTIFSPVWTAPKEARCTLLDGPPASSLGPLWGWSKHPSDQDLRDQNEMNKIKRREQKLHWKQQIKRNQPKSWETRIDSARGLKADGWSKFMWREGSITWKSTQEKNSLSLIFIYHKKIFIVLTEHFYHKDKASGMPLSQSLESLAHCHWRYFVFLHIHEKPTTITDFIWTAYLSLLTLHSLKPLTHHRSGWHIDIYWCCAAKCLQHWP